MEIDNLSGIFNGNVNGLEKKDNIIDEIKNKKISSGVVKGLDTNNLNHMFLGNKSNGGIMKMLGENIKPKKGVEKNIKDNLKGKGFFNMLSAPTSSKGTPTDKIGQILGNVNNKKSSMSGDKIAQFLGIANKNEKKVNVNNKANSMFNVTSKNTNKFNITNAFKTNNSNINVNKKLQQSFNIKGLVQGKDMSKKINSMIGSPKTLEQKGWFRANQQVGLNPLDDFDGDKVINMLDCNPRNKYQQGALDTAKKWIGIGVVPTEAEVVPTEVGRLQTYRDPNVQQTVQTEEETVIDIEPAKIGKAVWEGAKTVGSATVEGIANVAKGVGLYKSDEQRRLDSVLQHQQSLARMEIEGTTPKDVKKYAPEPEPRYKTFGKKVGGAISIITDKASDAHSAITRGVTAATPGFAGFGMGQGIREAVAMPRNTGNIMFMSQVGTQPLSTKQNLLGSYGIEPFSEKVKLVGGRPSEQSFSYKIQEAVGGLKPEDVELAERLQREKIENITKQEELDRQRGLERQRMSSQIARPPVPQQPMQQPMQQQIPGQQQYRQPVPSQQQQLAQHQLAQASPDVGVYSPYSKRKVGYTRGKYNKAPKYGVPQVTYYPPN